MSKNKLSFGQLFVYKNIFISKNSDFIRCLKLVHLTSNM